MLIFPGLLFAVAAIAFIVAAYQWAKLGNLGIAIAQLVAATLCFFASVTLILGGLT